MDAISYERRGRVAVLSLNRPETRDRLDDEVMELAQEIAAKEPFALYLTKRVVNQALDVQGFSAALQSCFDVHWLGHSHAVAKTNYPILVPDVATMKAKTR